MYPHRRVCGRLTTNNRPRASGPDGAAPIRVRAVPLFGIFFLGQILTFFDFGDDGCLWREYLHKEQSLGQLDVA